MIPPFRERARSLQVELIEQIDELLPLCDFLSLHMPLTEETHHILDERRLALCRKGVRIVNCARGGLIDEAARQSLENGRVAAAALDGFREIEPRPFCCAIWRMSSSPLTSERARLRRRRTSASK